MTNLVPKQLPATTEEAKAQEAKGALNFLFSLDKAHQKAKKEDISEHGGNMNALMHRVSFINTKKLRG